jgi:ADP-ribose pyrophosphatase
MADRRSRRDVELFEKTRAYDGFFKLDLYSFSYRRYDGTWSRRHTREVFDRTPTAAVLLYDPGRDEVVLVEQMRAPALDDPAGPWLVEVVAGIIEPGETAAEVVRREANEEAGLEVGELVALFDTLLSPGGSTERISLFVGRVDSARAGGVHGNADEEEDIRVVVWPLDEACAMIGTSIVTAPAIVCLQWLALNREQVRRKWGASEVAVP